MISSSASWFKNIGKYILWRGKSRDLWLFLLGFILDSDFVLMAVENAREPHERVVDLGFPVTDHIVEVVGKDIAGWNLRFVSEVRR